MTFWDDYRRGDEDPPEKPEPNQWAELFIALAIAGAFFFLGYVFAWWLIP